jgi:hypothetical protein
MRSQKFVSMLKNPALLNTNNHTVSLVGSEEDGVSCYFRVVPRFKVRSLGSKVFADDEVVFESVKFEGFVLSASTKHAYARAQPATNALVPRALRNPRTLEVSGWLLRRDEDGKPVTHTHMAASLASSGGGRGSRGGGSGRSSVVGNNFTVGNVGETGGGVGDDLGESDDDEEEKEKDEEMFGDDASDDDKCVASFQLKLFARFRAGDVAERLTTFTKVLLSNLLAWHRFVVSTFERNFIFLVPHSLTHHLHPPQHHNATFTHLHSPPPHPHPQPQHHHHVSGASL